MNLACSAMQTLEMKAYRCGKRLGPLTDFDAALDDAIPDDVHMVLLLEFTAVLLMLHVCSRR
jgi:hypothetical protein